MKKRLLAFILLLSIVLNGCGTGYEDIAATPEADNADTWEDDTEYEEEYWDYEDDTYEEEYEEVVVAAYPLTKLRPFSEGRAWVNFNKDGLACSGIIDTDGKLITQTEIKFSYISQFMDGCAYYYTEDSGCGIMDLDGNILFEAQESSDSEYKILAYGNGAFFAARHIQNFDTNEWWYGTIDKYGNILNDLEKLKIGDDEYLTGAPTDQDVKYIGENYIQLWDDVYYNLSTAEAAFPSYFPVAEFYEGYALCEACYYIYGYKVMGVDEWLDSADYDMDFYGEDPDSHGGWKFHGDFKWNNGLALGIPYPLDEEREEESDYGYYDKNWNLVTSLEQYCDKGVEGGPFGNGYAAVTLRGADSCRYASAVDQSGNLVYDPIKIDSGDVNNSANGYFQVTIDEEKKIIGPDGTIYTPGADDLSMLEGLTFGDVVEGFILMNQEEGSWGTSPYYVSLDANTIIDSAKVTSADVSAIEDKSWDDETPDAASYIVPDSYDIAGKWKSVGDSGFGQAQPGAIVIFDGSHCNFYSPNDTYAFYREDDRYVLDITSLLGESLSYTVHIIDDDNLEVAGASLMRVE